MQTPTQQPSKLDTSPRGLIRLYAYLVIGTGAMALALHGIIGLVAGFGHHYAPYLLLYDLGLLLLGWLAYEYSDAPEGKTRPYAVPLWLLSPYVVFVVSETGRMASPFIFLLLVTCVFGGLMMKTRGAILLAALTAALNGFATWMLPDEGLVLGGWKAIRYAIYNGRPLTLDGITSLGLHSAFLFLGTFLALRLARTFAQRVDTLTYRATRDPLTNLPNRRGFTEKMEQELVRAQRLSWPMAVLVIDLDHFKQVNDHYGHAFGDQVLIQASRILQETVGPVDHLARTGGEEFAVGAVGADPGQGEALALRILRAFRDFAWHDLSDRLKVTCSIGVTTLDPTLMTIRRGTTLDQLLDRADKALYDVKANGRDGYKVEGASPLLDKDAIPMR